MLVLNASRSYCRQLGSFSSKSLRSTSTTNHIKAVNYKLNNSDNHCHQYYNYCNVGTAGTNVISRRLYATTNNQNLKTNDGENNLIYYGPLATRMKMVKVFSLSTSLAGLAAQPILMEQGMKMGGTALAVFFCTLTGFFTFVTPLLLHFITKKYVTEIYYNAVKDEYTATTISIILHKIKTKFRPADVKVPEIPGMFTSFFVGKQALFVDASFFSDPEHYARIMGYDKPVDFKLDLKEIQPPTLKKEAKQKS